MNAIKSRLDAAEKRLKNKSSPVGVIIRIDGVWRLHIGGKEYDSGTEAEAKSAFYARAPVDGTLIIWG